MSWFSDANPISAIVSNTLGKVVDKALTYLPDAEAREKAREAIMQMDLSADAAQISVNVEEAKSQKWWEAGARPFALWVCGFALAYSYILQPFLTFAVRLWQPAFTPPTLEIQDLMALMSGLLGLGYMRSREKSDILAAKS